MRALLDTNIIIHRENNKITNKSIGELYYWIDKLNIEKVVHPFTVKEIEKFAVEDVRNLYSIKLKSYVILKSTLNLDESFKNAISHLNSKANDDVDNALLYEVYAGRVDILITEDRKIFEKAKCLNIDKSVYSIEKFLAKCIEENPELTNYKMLSVQKIRFSEIDLSDPFFDTLKNDYAGFEKWFLRKSDEEAYVCSSEGSVYGFLYIKVEGENELYSDINPIFQPKKRLKIGTFKVESTGFRLGERFIKIIFDNALQYDVDEIYVTLFRDRNELELLKDFLESWGFNIYGIKQSGGKEETVLVKKMKEYDENKDIKKNFPNLNFSVKKFIHPIFPKYYTDLLPDSILNTENKEEFISNKAHRYSLEKIYVQWMPTNNAQAGDIILFYRTGEYGSHKRYTSTITTVGVIEEIKDNFASIEEYLNYCENRSVFTREELISFWNNHRRYLKVLKFIYIKSLKKRPILDHLYDLGIVSKDSGPRSFTLISDEQFDKLLKISETSIK